MWSWPTSLFTNHQHRHSHDTTGQLTCPAPELLIGQGYAKAADWWAFGVLMYEILTGLHPFYAQDIEETHRNILTGLVHILELLDTATRDFLIKLLNPEPESRLGRNGALEIKGHAFLHGIGW
jgi:serum/glucocorticoid-regulated kinase 2